MEEIVTCTPNGRNSNFVHLLEEKVSCLSDIIDIDRFSSHTKLLKSTARVFAIFNKRYSFQNVFKDPSYKEITNAGNLWIIDGQRSMLNDIAVGKFQRLNPSLNDQGIYIVSGRMEY